MAERQAAEFRLSPAAQDDLGGIFDYTVRQWGLAHAERYTELIQQACSHLARNPSSGQSCENIRPGYRRRSVGRHVIYFRVENYGIAVIRILHHRMDAPRYL